jgi:Zn-dependent protease
VPRGVSNWLALNLRNSLNVNIVLCVFNMLPFPPLDGGRVAVGILPRFLARPLAQVEPYGMLILMLLFIVAYTGADRALGFDLFGWLIGVPANALYDLVLAVTGQGAS